MSSTIPIISIFWKNGCSEYSHTIITPFYIHIQLRILHFYYFLLQHMLQGCLHFFLLVPCTRRGHIIDQAQTGIRFCFLNTLPVTASQHWQMHGQIVPGKCRWLLEYLNNFLFSPLSFSNQSTAPHSRKLPASTSYLFKLYAKWRHISVSLPDQFPQKTCILFLNYVAYPLFNWL